MEFQYGRTDERMEGYVHQIRRTLYKMAKKLGHLGIRRIASRSPVHRTNWVKTGLFLMYSKPCDKLYIFSQAQELMSINCCMIN